MVQAGTLHGVEMMIGKQPKTACVATGAKTTILTTVPVNIFVVTVRGIRKELTADNAILTMKLSPPRAWTTISVIFRESVLISASDIP